MDQQFLKCPKCGTQIELTKVFTTQLEDKLRSEYDQKLTDEKKQIELRISKKTEERFAIELQDLKTQVQEKDEKIKQAQQNELTLRKRQRELDEREKAIDQTAEKLKEEYNQKYLAEKATLESRIKKEAQEQIAIELRDLKAQVQERDSKLQQLQESELELRKKQRALQEREKGLQDREEQLQVEYKQKLLAEKTKLEERVRKETQESVGIELRDLKSQVEEKDRKLKEALDNELKMRKQQRELEEREKNLQLEVQRKLAEESRKIWASAASKFTEDHRLKDAEKDKKIADMLQRIEDLKRKAEQGSQQTQGEVLEIELENLLRATFRTDDIQPVPKGTKGADVIQKVYTKLGNFCGTILWESKRTKSWNDSWLQKLKDDQREVKANLTVIVSIALPKNIKTFGLMDGVWVSDFSTVVGLATALREGMIEVARTKASLVGKSEKMEHLYAYLSGQEFRQRIEAVVESFATMKSDLDAEKGSMEKIWSKREQQILRVLKNTAGLYGDLQGIIGGALQPISRLELPSADDAQETT